MRKAVIPGFGNDRGLTTSGSWLNLEELTTAELSSEDPVHPFEQALEGGHRGRMEGLGTGAAIDPSLL